MSTSTYRGPTYRARVSLLEFAARSAAHTFELHANSYYNCWHCTESYTPRYLQSYTRLLRFYSSLTGISHFFAFSTRYGGLACFSLFCQFFRLHFDLLCWPFGPIPASVRQFFYHSLKNFIFYNYPATISSLMCPAHSTP